MAHYVLGFSDKLAAQALLSDIEDWHHVDVIDGDILRNGWHVLVWMDSLPEKLAPSLAARPWNIEPAIAGGIISAPEKTAMHVHAATAFQLRLALHRAGLLDVVEAAFNKAGPEHVLWWNYTGMITSDHPEMIAIMTAIGKTAAEKDALFDMAASL